MSRSKLIVGLAAGLTAATLASSANAAVVTLQAGFGSPVYANGAAGSTDARVRGDSANVNTADAQTAGLEWVGQLSGGGDLRTLYSFNLSSIPTGATFSAASLKISSNFQDASTASDTEILTFGVDLTSTTTFNPTTVTWSTQPAPGTVLSSLNLTSGKNGAGGTTGASTFASSTAFVTAIQNAYAAGGQTVYFSLKATDENITGHTTNRHIFFTNSNEESVTASLRPELSVTYAVPEPTSIALLGLASIGLMARRRRTA